MSTAQANKQGPAGQQTQGGQNLPGLPDGQGGSQTQHPPHQAQAPPIPTYSHEQFMAAQEAARRDAMAQYQADLEKAKNDRQALEEANRKLRDFEIKTSENMTSEQKIQAQLAQMSQDLHVEREARVRAQAMADEKERIASLNTYRYRRLSEEGGALFPAMVGGGSEQEIEASIARSKAEYANMYSQMRAQVAAEYGQQPPGMVPSVAVGAHNPNYTAPQFARIPDPVAPPAPGVEQFASQVQALTAEEAVRSGAYGKNRDAIFGKLREALPTGINGDFRFDYTRPQSMPTMAPPSSPQYSAPPPSVPYNHHQYPNQQQQQPQPGYQPQQSHQGYAPPQQQPYQGQPAPNSEEAARQAAIASVNRLHSGGRQVAGVKVPEANYGDMQQVFNHRFEDSPPIQEVKLN